MAQPLFDHPRLPDWERRLNAWLLEPGREKFEYGVQDCALFGCGAVMAMTGVHPAPQFVGAYGDAASAAEALRELGKGTLLKTFDQYFKRKKPAFAHRGDLVMAHKAIGVCMGANGVFLAQEIGLARLPRSAFVAAWKV